MRGFIIACSNNKGGVGKTVTTCNLAHALTKFDKRVLVIDIDSQCNATNLLMPANIDVKFDLYDLLNPATSPPQVEQAIYPSKYKNLFCIPNSESTATLEPDLMKGYPDSLHRLRHLVREYAIRNFDFTIIDCPPNMGNFVLMPFFAADFVLVPTEVDSAFSHDGLIKIIKIIKEIQEKVNPDLRFLRLLVNKIDNRTSISKIALDHLRSTFTSDQVFSTTIPINTAFKQAEHYGESLLRFRPSATGARAFKDLADELIAIFKQEEMMLQTN